MITQQLHSVDSRLENFIKTCNDLGYTNNGDLKSLKFEWCLDNGGAWWGTYDKDNTQISMSGIHPFKDGYRALFRGVQLYSRNIGLSRYHMQSHCFYYELPEQIKFAKDKPIYITTSFSSDASGRMNKVDKIFYHLESAGIVTYYGSELVYNTLQNVWVLDTERYFEVRNK
jgi:hypothetical protein